MTLPEAIFASIAAATGEPARPRRAHTATGGSIHPASIVELEDGRRFFVKTGASAAGRDVFAREAEGLEALRRAAPGLRLRVPEVIDWSDGDAGGGSAFLILEAIEIGPVDGEFHIRFGRALAELHRTATAERFGFTHDNFLGATPQPNGWLTNWVDFWRRHRLDDQLGRARRAGRGDRKLFRLGDRLLERLGDILPTRPVPSLLHGDLWGGNYLCDPSGVPVLIDPAAYYGDREADLAMTRLFGGFPPAFERAYREAWPLPPGNGRRALVYELHHWLNHLNLFGDGYLGHCRRHLERLVG
ncbi:MAG: fructosamine kinase family protein [Acidobacteriota bacterium]